VTGHEVGPAADRYSLATIAYEMLTGSIPFEGLGVIELLYAHVHSEPARPSSINRQLNEKVDGVILRGLAKEPGSRWATCEQFVNALGNALGTKATAGVERTIAMAPAAAATAAAAADRTVAIAPAPQRSESLFAPPPTTVPPPVWGPAVAAERRSRRRRIAAIVIAILLLLALIAATLSYVFGELLQPTLALSSGIVEPGSLLTVSATHLPANQIGEIRLQSQLYTFTFSADANGSLTEAITIPLDIGIGGHHVSLCWSGSCPLVEPLTVVPPGTLPSPSPSAEPSGSPSPSGSGKPTAKPTPGRSPAPGSSPTPNRSPNPRPTPTPTPTTNPCPTPTAKPVLKPSPTSVIGGSTVTLTGTNFTPHKVVKLIYYKGSVAGTTWLVIAACDGSFTTAVQTAGGVLRTDKVTARDSTGRFASANIGILL